MSKAEDTANLLAAARQLRDALTYLHAYHEGIAIQAGRPATMIGPDWDRARSAIEDTAWIMPTSRRRP